MDDFISYDAVVEDYGQEVADRLLGYRRHHHGDAKQPYWPDCVADELLELMRIEDEREEARDQ